MNEKDWHVLIDFAVGIICNAQPDKSLDAEHAKGWEEARKRFLKEAHEAKESRDDE